MQSMGQKARRDRGAEYRHAKRDEMMEKRAAMKLDTPKKGKKK